MTARKFLTRYLGQVKLSGSALRNLAIVQVHYAYTGVMELATGIIDLCGAAGTNPNYSTKTPIHTHTFPQYVGLKDVAPIVHGGKGSDSTSHQILARCVIEDKSRRASDESDFCGFTVRFNAKPNAQFSGTSRSLNTGEGFSNGELEECLRTIIMEQLSTPLRLYKWLSLEYAPPRIDPDAAQRARGGPVAPKGLFNAIQAKGKPS